MTINYDHQGHFKLQCCTAENTLKHASMGMGLVGVHIFVPIPIPSLTHDFYPCKFLYPCQSLIVELDYRQKNTLSIIRGCNQRHWLCWMPLRIWMSHRHCNRTKKCLKDSKKCVIGSFCCGSSTPYSFLLGYLHFSLITTPVKNTLVVLTSYTLSDPIHQQ